MTEELREQVVNLVARGEVDRSHPYLAIWLGCKRHSTDFHRVLPASGGWLDQDAELMLAFEIIEDIYQQETRAAEIHRKQSEESEKRRRSILAH